MLSSLKTQLGNLNNIDSYLHWFKPAFSCCYKKLGFNICSNKAITPGFAKQV